MESYESTEEFWKTVEEARDPDVYAATEKLRALLAEASDEALVAFQTRLVEQLARSYTTRLWGAAYLINGGCSDDGFEYFRGWLIAQGQQAFDAALTDPDSLSSLVDGDEVECEDYARVAGDVYRKRTGEWLPRPDVSYPTLDWSDAGDFDDDGQMAKAYPALFAKVRS